MTESPINEILIAHVFNAATQRSSFTCDLRPRTKCSYCHNNFYFQLSLTLSLDKSPESGNPYITLEQTISQKKMSKYNWKAQN